MYNKQTSHPTGRQIFSRTQNVTFGKVGRGNRRLFSPCLTTADALIYAQPANLQPVVSGDFSLLCRTPHEADPLLQGSGPFPSPVAWLCALPALLSLLVPGDQLMPTFLLKPGPQTLTLLCWLMSGFQAVHLSYDCPTR